MNSELKEAIASIRTILAMCDPAMVDVVELHGVAGEQFALEILLYMTYLAASDNVLDWDECEVVEYYTGVSMSPDELKYFIIENVDYLRDFGLTIPQSFATLVEADNKCISEGAELKVSSSKLLFEIYKSIAAEVITADGQISVDEKIEANLLLNKIAIYIDLNLLDK